MKLLAPIAHLFFPRHSNNHRAKVLHHSSIFVIILSLLFIQFGIESLQKDSQVLGYASQISVDEVIRLTNVKRSEAGLPPVTFNSQLSQAATAKGAHMLANDYWAHVAPDGTQPWKFFSDANYKYRYAGENLARDFSSAQAAIDGWMASPSHRENMLSPKYKEIGIGVVEGDLAGQDTTLVVQLFGVTLADTPVTPNLAQATQSPANTTPIAVVVALNSPVPLVTPIPTPVAILAQINPTPVATPTPQVLISPFTTTRGISLIVLGIILLAFVIDIVVISRRRIYRVSGRTLGHAAFLGMIFAVVIIMRAGKIL